MDGDFSISRAHLELIFSIIPLHTHIHTRNVPAELVSLRARTRRYRISASLKRRAFWHWARALNDQGRRVVKENVPEGDLALTRVNQQSIIRDCNKKRGPDGADASACGC